MGLCLLSTQDRTDGTILTPQDSMRVVCLPIHESLILYDKYTDKMYQALIHPSWVLVTSRFVETFASADD